MKKIFRKAWTRWKDLAWYWKPISFVLLIGLATLWVLSLFSRDDSQDVLNALDKRQEKKTDAALSKLREQEEEVTKLIRTKKKEIGTKLNQAAKIDATTVKRREEINGATTMEKLDELQKKWGL